MGLLVHPKYAMEFRAVFRDADSDIDGAKFHLSDGIVATVHKNQYDLHICASTSDDHPISDVYIPIEDVKILASAMRDYEANEDYEYAKCVASYFTLGRWSYDRPMSVYSD